MAHDYTVGEGDLEGPINVPGGLMDENGVIVLTGASVRWKMRGVLSDTLVVDAPAVIDAPLLGTVHYNWTAGDTDTPGQFYGQWEVTLPSGRTIRVPNDRWYDIWIQPAVGP